MIGVAEQALLLAQSFPHLKEVLLLSEHQMFLSPLYIPPRLNSTMIYLLVLGMLMIFPLP